MIAKINSSLILGIEGVPLEIEVDITSGLPMFATVGLPDSAVKESKDRVKAAIRNSGFDFPNKRITVNLAPANIKKEGAGYDLPIAIGILSASGIVPPESIDKKSFIGELSLDGRIRGVNGVLAHTLCARDNSMKGVFVPSENAREAEIVNGVEIYSVTYLHQLVEFLCGESMLQPLATSILNNTSHKIQPSMDLADVKGQQHAKRALEIAAGGNHNIILKGPPGSGKTMLARRMTTILPELSFAEAIESTKAHSIAGVLNNKCQLLSERPFRAPHHTISDAGLVGGGSMPKPGEISLAHNGVLFLDELTEFSKRVLELLRQPLEDRKITISRANTSLDFPADFMLIGAYNPCPCGYLGDTNHRCNCNSGQIQRYMAKLSGPLLDRIDMHIEVPAVSHDEMLNDSSSEKSDDVKQRVKVCRETQEKRFANYQKNITNATMPANLVKKYCRIDTQTRNLLKKSIARLGLSARAYHRVLKIARTIADMDQCEKIAASHVAEAIQYRRLG